MCITTPTQINHIYIFVIKITIYILFISLFLGKRNLPESLTAPRQSAHAPIGYVFLTSYTLIQLKLIGGSFHFSDV